MKMRLRSIVGVHGETSAAPAVLRELDELTINEQTRMDDYINAAYRLVRPYDRFFIFEVDGLFYSVHTRWRRRQWFVKPEYIANIGEWREWLDYDAAVMAVLLTMID